MVVFHSFLVSVIIHFVTAQIDGDLEQVQRYEGGRFSFIELALKYGYSAEAWDVTTKDGYILRIFNMPGGDKRRPVMLQHGLLGSADAFIIRGFTSLAIALRNLGYDVWVANSRGNKYSRRHQTLSPDRDKIKFFDYSFTEFAMYDCPAFIDFILEKTGQEALSVVGHSEGTTMFFALGAALPEYNKKIKILAAMAPVAFFNHVRPPVLPLLVQLSPTVNLLLSALGDEELLGPQSTLREFLAKSCSVPIIGYKVCVDIGFFSLVGYNPDQLEPEFVPTFFEYYFSGTSRKNFYHLAQLGKRDQFFGKYDYGPAKNKVVYNSQTPPEYDLSKVTMKVALIVGKNDLVATKEDAVNIRKRLPNVVDFHVLEPPDFNHIDFLVGRDTYKVMYPYLFDLLEKYNEDKVPTVVHVQ